MTLQTVTGLEGGQLESVIRELQQLKIRVAAGAAAATDITVAGIATIDTLVQVLRLDRDAVAANINLTAHGSEASITAADTIQLSTTDTTGDTLIVVYFDKVL